MQHDSITATELARNISTSIDKVRMSGRSLYITKGSNVIAELSPAPKPGFPIENLANLLTSLPSLGEDAQAMSQDLNSIREKSTLPDSSWD